MLHFKVVRALKTRASVLVFLFLIAASVTASFAVRAHAERSQFKERNVAASSAMASFASLNLAISVAQDGLATLNTTADKLNGINVCSTNPTPGCDFSQNNGIVRTNDSVVYSYDYSVNGLAEDITLTATAPMGTTWNVLPAFCLSGSSLNTGDGVATASVITCKRGIQTLGTAESLPFTATVLGSTNNATILTASGSVSGPTSVTATATAPTVTVSAAPHFNLRQTYSNYAAYRLNSVVGYRIEYRAMIETYDDSVPAAYAPRYGSAALSTPITFTDVVSQISPNAVLQSCAKISDTSGSGGGNGGTITCTQSAAGQDIAVSVANANTTLSQWTTPPSDNRMLAGSYQIFVFIPATDVANAPGQSLATTNTLTNFDPNSTASQSNFDTAVESITDNVITRSFTPLTGSFGVAYVKNYNNNNTSTVGTLVGSDRFVAPTEVFAVQLSLNNNTGGALNNVALCALLDNAKYSVIETTTGSGVVYGNDTPAPTSVEYAAGYVNANWMPTAGGGNPTGMRTECNDPGVVWYSSPTAVPGGLSAISKYRVKYNTLAGGAVGTVRVRVQARETNFYSSQTIFNGTVMPAFGIWRSDELNTNYSNSTYYQNVYPNSATGSPGARLFLARAVARITAETESNNTVNSVLTGGSIGYVLKPTLATVGTANPVQVTVTDVLPVGLSYIVGTGQQNSTTFEPQIITCTANAAPDSHCTANGQQLLVWTLNNQVPNVAIGSISFRAAADLSVLNNQTVINTAIVSSPADPSAEVNRTATRNVTGASPSTLLVFKNSTTSQIEVNSPFSYTVSYRNASLGLDFTSLDFIDVLPYNGDANLPFNVTTYQRTPASSFNGTRSLTSVSATSGSVLWFYTNAAPATINSDPKHLSNLSPGVGLSMWCAGTAAGPAVGCGFTIDQTTAVRMLDIVILPRTTAIRSFTLNFASSGNQANDRYTNSASASTLELALSVNSNNVPIVVLESSVGGQVWFDTNGDGVRGAEETGRIGGSTVTLAGTSGAGATVNQSTTTAANGTYSFAHIPSGTYTVQFTRPNGYRAGTQDAGGDDSLDSDANVTTLVTAPFALGVNNSKVNVDQGFYQMNLGGMVWRDLNSNGLLDVGEAGGPGFAVDLLDNGSNVIQSVQTDVNGNYTFVDLLAGDYKVRVMPPPYISGANWVSNPNNNVAGDNNGHMQSGWAASNAITLAPGTEPIVDQPTGMTLNRTLDFALVSVSPTAAGATLSGRLLTADGHGIVGARVLLVDQNGAVHYALTNPFGYYRFTEVMPSTLVTISVSAKGAVFSSNIRLVSVNADDDTINFVADPVVSQNKN